MAPRFLTINEVVEIHENQIELYGGSLGVRDRGLLESALAVPSSGFGGEFFHEDMAAMAAAYLFHLAKNYPFVDGNKRMAAVAARVFLRINDLAFSPPEKDYEELTLAVAAGEADKGAVTAFFRKHVKQPRKRRSS